MEKFLRSKENVSHMLPIKRKSLINVLIYKTLKKIPVVSLGIEPRYRASEAHILSIVLRDQKNLMLMFLKRCYTTNI